MELIKENEAAAGGTEENTDKVKARFNHVWMIRWLQWMILDQNTLMIYQLH